MMAPHPRSPAARNFDWSGLSAPHLDSPAAPHFDWASSNAPHPNSPAGREVDGGAGFDAGRRRATVPASLSGVEKLKIAVERSLPKLPAKVREKVKAMLTPQALATLVALGAAWGASHWIGIGEAVDVFMVGWGVWTFGWDAVDAGKDLYKFVTVATSAKNDKDIDRAADYFAHAIAVIGVDGLVVILAHQTFKAVRSGGKSAPAEKTSRPAATAAEGSSNGVPEQESGKSKEAQSARPDAAAPVDPRVRTDLDSKWIDKSGNVKWPPDNGVSGAEQPGTLAPGKMIGRYGSEKGSFASPPGVSYPSLSLPYDANAMPYREYEVVKPLDYMGGDIAPWFDQPGGAMQYRFGQSVQSLLEKGYLRPAK